MEEFWKDVHVGNEHLIAKEKLDFTALAAVAMKMNKELS